ncbi:hypothetical protein [Ekhidna sp. To15]|uniref:hypothetical protein n=1 Tax=Ekhidna sp. To15 TaxID=3395267 RepID=UPI003F51B52E
MYFKIIKSSFLIILLLSSCVAQQANEAVGILRGTIGIYEGNCMPGPGVEPCKPRPISATILITSVSEEYNEDLLIKKLNSNQDGEYEVQLTVGEYSLFLMDGTDVVCTLIQCPDKCICHPFRIAQDSATVIDANLDHATW